MPGDFEQLHDQESVLLMYLAGELSDEEQARVHQMLEADVELKRLMERMEQSRATAYGALAALDAAEPLSPAAAEAGARLVIRSRLDARRPLPQPTAAPAERLRLGWWVYPVAVAAMVLIAFLAWLGNHTPSTPMVKLTPPPKAVNDPGVHTPDEVPVAVDPFVPIAPDAPEASKSLNDAAAQLASLSGSADDEIASPWVDMRR